LSNELSFFILWQIKLIYFSPEEISMPNLPFQSAPPPQPSPRDVSTRPGRSVWAYLVGWQRKIDQSLAAFDANATNSLLPHWLLKPRFVHALEVLFAFCLALNLYWFLAPAPKRVLPGNQAAGLLPPFKRIIPVGPGDKAMLPQETRSFSVQYVPVSALTEVLQQTVSFDNLPFQVQADEKAKTLTVTAGAPVLDALGGLLKALDQPIIKDDHNYQVMEIFVRLNNYNPSNTATQPAVPAR
jgi:hypothetical protein